MENVGNEMALVPGTPEKPKETDQEILAELKASLARLPKDQRKRVAHHLLLRLPALRNRLANGRS
jgi:hypothetical protein